MRKCVAARGENLQSDLGVKGLSPSQTMDFTYMFVTGPVTLSCDFEETLFKQPKSHSSNYVVAYVCFVPL